ncbi:hypothetical protein QWJ23_37035, partial [Streptomyces sp. ZSW22]|nr:hypothetical protein [Streptomyces sp. ZSW22]
PGAFGPLPDPARRLGDPEREAGSVLPAGLQRALADLEQGVEGDVLPPVVTRAVRRYRAAQRAKAGATARNTGGTPQSRP